MTFLVLILALLMLLVVGRPKLLNKKLMTLVGALTLTVNASAVESASFDQRVSDLAEVLEQPAASEQPIASREPITSVDLRACQPEKTLNLEFPGCWYLGAGLGLSQITPDVEGTAWRVSDDMDMGFKVHVGYHFLPHWFAEFSYADLGATKMKLRNPNPQLMSDEEITYNMPELALGYYVLNPVQNPWNIYVKVGISQIMTQASSSSLSHKEEGNTQLSLSLGAQYQIDARWFARAEINRYSSDASYIGLSISRYFGEATPVIMAAQPEPVIEVVPVIVKSDSDNDGVMDDVDSCPDTIEGTVVNESGCIADADVDGINDDVDACVDTPSGIKVNKLGCAVFEGALQGIQFEVNSSELTKASKILLVEVAAALIEYNDLKLEIQAYTDNRGGKSYNLLLSQRRAQSVVDYLVSQNVSADRLRAQGYGESRPEASNATPAGRAANRRVEFLVLE